MRRIKPLLQRAILIFMAALTATTPVYAARSEGDTVHKGDLYYYTQNGIIFYEGGTLHCGNGAALVGGAAGMLAQQKNLDPKWIPVIIAAASKAGADPIAMAGLLFWEHRGFPAYGAGPQPGESDSVGRGAWQIIRASWPASAGSYDSGVYDPQKATEVAANLVKSYGGIAGSPIGSIAQDFSKGKNIPSMATLAKNYNAGRFTWRNPASASYGQAGRVWYKGDGGAWFDQKQGIIDDYIVAMTYAYYQIATGQSLGNVNTSDFVQDGLKNQAKIQTFKITDGSNTTGNVDQQCSTGEGNGDIVATAKSLAWPNTAHNVDSKSAATPAYQDKMPKIEGDDIANSISPDGWTAWSDCGVFVATVMRLSGADDKYAKRGTSVQIDYIKTSGKYDVFPNFTNESQLKPGDVLIFSDPGSRDSGHTYIYTGKYKGDDGRTYSAASASFGDHVPMAENVYFDTSYGHHFTVARLKANVAATPTTGAQ